MIRYNPIVQRKIAISTLLLSVLFMAWEPLSESISSNVTQCVDKKVA